MAELDVGRCETPAFKLFGTLILAESKPTKSTGPDQASTRTEHKSAAAAAAAAAVATEAAAEAARGAAALPCPRCKSRETKFCYFNNYNVNQPRHFCRACHRYWTAGGTLRNVPIGAGRRRGRPAAIRGVGSTSSCVIEYGTDGRAAVERWVLPPTRGFSG